MHCWMFDSIPVTSDRPTHPHLLSSDSQTSPEGGEVANNLLRGVCLSGLYSPFVPEEEEAQRGLIS